RQAFDRLDAAAVRLDGEKEARAHGGAVQPHRASAAHAVLGTDVRAGERERVSDEIREQESWLDRLPVAASVHRYLDLDHGPPSDAAARAACHAPPSVSALRCAQRL